MTEGKTSDWLTPQRFVVLLGLLIIVSFARVVFGINSFAFGDFGQFAYPVAFYSREAFWHGEIPLWDPLNCCGIPFLAQWNTMTLYPLSLFYLVFPISWSLSVFCLGHLFLAGVGMYFLAFRWVGNRLGAAIAGSVFAFNGLTWYGLMWPNIIVALGWMPWVVLAVEQAWAEGRRFILLAALTGAMQMLSGGVTVIIQTWIIIGTLWLAQLLRREISWTKTAPRLLGTGGLIAGLTAVQTLPFLDLLIHSQRGVNYVSSNMAAMPLTGWANYLVPLFHCVRLLQGMFVPANTIIWTGSYYLGVGVVALSLLAVWRVRNYRARMLAALALFSLLMALGGHALIYDWVKRLMPLLGFMRFPVKFVILANFTLPLLAAYGLGWLQTLPSEKRAGEWKKTGCLLFALVISMAVILLYAWQRPLVQGDFALAIWSASTRVLFLGLIFGCMALLQRLTDLKWQWLLQSCLIILFWFDVLTHNSNLSPTVARVVLAPNSVRQFFKWDGQVKAGISRAMPTRASRSILSAGNPNPIIDIFGRRLSLSCDYNLLDHVPLTDGFFALWLKNYSQVFRRAFFATNEPSKLEAFLGVSHVTNPTNILEWTPRNSFLPMITAGQKPIFAPDTEVLPALFSRKFKPLQVVYLPMEAQGRIQANGNTKVKILSSNFSPQRVGIEIESSAPAMVVVAQAFYPAWHAYVDGRPVPLWRANYAFQALEVPSGIHQIALIYQNRMFFLGGVFSFASLIIWVAAWFWWKMPVTPAT